MTSGTGVDLVQLVRTILEGEDERLAKQLADGVVAEVSGSKCSVRLGGVAAPALPGWTVPPSLTVLEGDHVQVYRQGGYQLVLEVLNRNALNASQDGGTGGTEADENLDGGTPTTVYGGTTAIDGGAP